jgi:hypothetical protein
MHAQAQNKLTKIKDSNYFTDQRNVYFVMSNNFNNSGRLSKFMGNKLQIIDTTEYDSPPNNNTFLLNSDTRKNSCKKLANNIIMVSSNFLKSSDFLYQQYLHPLTIAVKMPGIKPNEVNIISSNYIRINDTIFWTTNKIDAKADSIVILLDGFYAYAKDNNNVYMRNKIIKNADAKTFEMISFTFAKDKNHIFFCGDILKDADPHTFQILSYTYQRDKNHVWTIGKPCDIDANSFKILNEGNVCNNNSLYATDKKYVYFQGEIINGADVKTFHLITSDAPCQTYGIDKNHIYYNNKILEYADVKTFQVVNKKTSEIQYDAFDKNNCYVRDEVVNHK